MAVSRMIEAGERAVLRAVGTWYAKYTTAPVQGGTLIQATPGQPGYVGNSWLSDGLHAAAVWQAPFGWQVAHLIRLDRTTPVTLETTRNALLNIGIDSVFWLGLDAASEANRTWVLSQQGFCGTLDFDMRQRVATADMFACSYLDGAWRPTQYTPQGAAWYLYQWRRTGYVRYLEAWKKLDIAQTLRGFAATGELAQSLGQFISIMVADGTLYTQPNGTMTVDNFARLYRPYFPQMPETGVEKMRRLARSLATATVPQQGVLAV